MNGVEEILTLQEIMLLRLQEVLRVKNFSLPVKQKIKETLLAILELDIENKEDYISSIIEGLQAIDTFKINTRKQLLKVKNIQNSLLPNTLGLVDIKNQLVAVVKSEYEKATICHELVHVSQKDSSYYLPKKYAFSHLFQEAMREGEAIYREMQFQQKNHPKFSSLDPTISRLTLFSYHSVLYDVFLELYQDMRNLLGDRLLEKWKSVNFEDDMMIELEQYTNHQYGCSFSAFYRIWSGLLYYFSVHHNQKRFFHIAQQDLELYGQQHQKNSDCYNELHIVMMNNQRDIEELKKKIESIDIVLENENILEKEFISAIEYEKQELKRYLQEYGEDEVTQQWQEELRVVTIDDYREVLEGEKKQYEEHIAMHNQKILEITQQSQSIEWLESFALKRYDFTDVEFLAMWKEQMLVTIQHHLLNVRDETKLPSTLYYSFHKEDEEIYGKNH